MVPSQSLGLVAFSNTKFSGETVVNSRQKTLIIDALYVLAAALVTIFIRPGSAIDYKDSLMLTCSPVCPRL